jgi:hypothetical protein
MMPALKIERCEQFYTDTDARSAQTYLYGALPVISPRPKSARGPSPTSSVGFCLVGVCMRKRTEPPHVGLCLLSLTPNPPRPPLHWRGREARSAAASCC